ncbi:hypothetical protein UZ36_00080 [Candidatus Nitromaritima sp. SCGC AAA799-C22]|nr:hypothetical protein UZ36_00080 [Candidatus Nitromaritima sp. SCGC AAA799-C22]
MELNKENRSLIIYLFLFGILASMSLLKYHNLNSTVFDLGIFLHNFSNIAEGEWNRLFLSHSQPLMFLWSLFYKFLPGEIPPGLVLISQAAFLAFPVMGLYRYYGILPALAFALYFPLWYNALFDFHMDHLAVPILFTFFFLEKRGNIWGAVIVGVLLALVKEPFALQTAFCGLYLALCRRQRAAGAVLILFGFLYFLGATQYVQKYFNSHFIFLVGESNIITLDSSAYTWFGSSLPDKIWFILFRPHLVLWNIISTPDKVLFILYLFGSLGFISLLSPSALLVSIPIWGASLLSQFPGHYGFTHHYTAGLIAPMIIAFAEGLPKARRIWDNHGLKEQAFYPLVISGLFVCHILLSPSPIGRKFYIQKAWFHHYSVYFPQERNRMIKKAIRTHIPAQTDAVLSIQNTMNWDYLTQRKIFFVFPHGATEMASSMAGSSLNWKGFSKFLQSGQLEPIQPERRWADFVILDMKRPWFIGDRGCHWISGRCRNGEDFEVRFLDLVEKTKERFDPVFEYDGFIILKRRDFETS